MQSRRHKQIKKAIHNMVESRHSKFGMLTWDELFNEIDNSVSERMKEIEQEMYKSLAISADILYNKAKEDEERWKKYI